MVSRKRKSRNKAKSSVNTTAARSLVSMSRRAIPKVAPESGGMFVMDLSPSAHAYPGSNDQWATANTGFKATDFVEGDLIKRFDEFRIVSITYNAAISKLEPGRAAGYVKVFVRECHDKIDLPPTPIKFFQMDAVKEHILCYNKNPSKDILTYRPRRRISTNADPSQQKLPAPGEWCDTRYAGQMIFGNIALMCLSPDGNVEEVLITSTVTIECRGIVHSP